METRSHCARTPVDSLSLDQYSTVGTVIVINEKHSEKHTLTVITTLGNVAGYFGDDNASGSRYER